MAIAQIRRTCKTCQQPRLFTKQKPNHILHLLLSCCTLSLWIPVWILLTVLNAFVPFRCTQCGQSKLT